MRLSVLYYGVCATCRNFYLTSTAGSGATSPCHPLTAAAAVSRVVVAVVVVCMGPAPKSRAGGGVEYLLRIGAPRTA